MPEPIMDHNTKLAVYRAMKKWGGSFVVALAEALMKADKTNQAKIEKTWPEYIAKYKKFAEGMEDNDGRR